MDDKRWKLFNACIDVWCEAYIWFAALAFWVLVWYLADSLLRYPHPFIGGMILFIFRVPVIKSLRKLVGELK